VETGRFEEGVKVFVDCIAANEKDWVALVMMARFNLEAGRSDEARLYLEKAQAVVPDNPDVLELMKQCDLQEEAPDETVRAKCDQGFALLNDFKEKAAEACFNESLKAGETAEAMMGLALCAIRKEQQIRAITTLNKLIEKWPDYSAAYNQLGILYFQNGELENALSSFGKAIELDAAFLEAQRNYGLCLVESGDYKNGIEVFNHILGKHPDDAETLLILANFYAEIERWEEAGKFVEKVLANDPGNNDAHRLKKLLAGHLSMEVL